MLSCQNKSRTRQQFWHFSSSKKAQFVAIRITEQPILLTKSKSNHHVNKFSKNFHQQQAIKSRTRPCPRPRIYRPLISSAGNKGHSLNQSLLPLGGGLLFYRSIYGPMSVVLVVLTILEWHATVPFACYLSLYSRIILKPYSFFSQVVQLVPCRVSPVRWAKVLQRSQWMINTNRRGDKPWGKSQQVSKKD